ncbi:MAG: hypothetical protein MZV64_36170 [Ignavibacteriales bacterium]|nr:hypothetical protein [Ignavibacteriales bacterium]
MEPINELVAVRKDKEKYFRSVGIETYPQDRGTYTDTAGILQRFGAMSHDELEKEGISLSVAGRIVAFRDFGKSSFLHIQDREGKDTGICAKGYTEGS